MTKGKRYSNALLDVANAARKVEEARVEFEDTTDRLAKKKRLAEEKLREVLRVAVELTGGSLPVSQQDKQSWLLKETLRELDEKKAKK